MTSDNTTRFHACGYELHVCSANSTRERPEVAILPRRSVGASAWPEPARPMASRSHPDLLVAVIDGLRRLDSDGDPR